MAEVLLAFEGSVADESGRYRARVVGRLAEDGMWEGWLEFEPLDRDADTLIGPVESRQPEFEHLTYWASGLTPVYLEGALHRARRPKVVRTTPVETPVSDKPAPRTVTKTAVPLGTRPEAIVDPFEVARQSGLDVLEQELHALNRPRLLAIIDHYDLNPAGEEIDWMNQAQLVRFVLVAVETQLLNRVR